MTASSPQLSIIIPTFRREDMLREAVPVLAVPGWALEVLVIDDSPEAGRAVVQALGDARVQYLAQQPPSGGRRPCCATAAPNWRAGGCCIFWMTTIACGPRRWHGLAGALLDSDRGVAIGLPQPFGPDADRWPKRPRISSGRPIFSRGILHRGGSRRVCCSATPCWCAAPMLRRETFMATGGFNPAMAVCEDIDLFMRAVRQGRHLFLGEALVERRVGGPSLISQASAAQMVDAYRQSQAAYRRQRGAAEFWALKVLNRRLFDPVLTVVFELPVAFGGPKFDNQGPFKWRAPREVFHELRQSGLPQGLLYAQSSSLTRLQSLGQQLSSGRSINSAQDNAAGLAQLSSYTAVEHGGGHAGSAGWRLFVADRRVRWIRSAAACSSSMTWRCRPAMARSASDRQALQARPAS
jgi:GT2 family glycosyltransferase